MVDCNVMSLAPTSEWDGGAFETERVQIDAQNIVMPAHALRRRVLVALGRLALVLRKKPDGCVAVVGADGYWLMGKPGQAVYLYTARFDKRERLQHYNMMSITDESDLIDQSHSEAELEALAARLESWLWAQNVRPLGETDQWVMIKETFDYQSRASANNMWITSHEHGKPFACGCGCYVFTLVEHHKYRCNNCATQFNGQ